MENNDKKVYALMMNTEADDNFYPDYSSIAGVFSTYEKAKKAAKKLDNIYKDELAPGLREYHGCNIVAYTLDHLYEKEADS